jgi:hypothetical protein
MKPRWKRLVIVAMVTMVMASVAVGFLLLWIRHPGDQPYSLIEPGLYLGSSVELPPQGTQAVVNLCGRPDSYQVGPSLWVPLYEAGPDVAQQKPSLDLLRRLVAFIDEQRRGGRTTYVHCMLGQNRSAAAVTAYLMWEHRMKRDEALSFLRRLRPMVQLDPSLMQLLAEWEQVIKAK